MENAVKKSLETFEEPTTAAQTTQKRRKLTFFNQQSNDPVRVKDEITSGGVLVPDDGEQSSELVRARECDRVRW